MSDMLHIIPYPYFFGSESPKGAQEVTLYFCIFFFSNDRDACGIPDEKTKSVIITGGYKSQFQVMRYNLKGFMEEIRPMLTGRSSHGCAGYHQDEKLVS